MTEQDLKECIAEVKHSAIQEQSKEKIINTLQGNRWIPITDRYPKNDNFILLSFDNFSLPMVGRYEKYENGGAFYLGDEDIPCSKQDLFVIAWRPLPEPYKESED